jgi:hypothetical protein
MRRLALIPLIAALAAPAPAAARVASVNVTECVPSLVPEQRVASFEARARAVAFSERMQLRFTVQSKAGGELIWQRVLTPGLDGWRTSLPGVRRYAYTRTLQNLAAPAAYRTVVRFRWLDGDGEVVRAARVTSRACRQPDLRPDLVPELLEAGPVRDDGLRRYVVTVRNDGRTAAGPSAVALGDVTAPLEVVEPGATQAAVLLAPACAPGEPVTAVADAGAAVDERDEGNDALVVPCPL